MIFLGESKKSGVKEKLESVKTASQAQLPVGAKNIPII